MKEHLTTTQRVIAALEELLGDYWDQGFTEGSTRQPQPEPANETLSKIRAVVRDALEAKDAKIARILRATQLANAHHDSLYQDCQAEIAALRQKVSENELMAECTVMLRDDLIEAGIVDKTVPPMMLTEAILRYASALRKDAERLDLLDQQGYAYGFQDMHEGNRWLIEGPFKSLRVAIDEAIAQAVQPS
jgi:hypothetical protein